MGKKKYGYMDASGVEVIPPTFNNAFSFTEGLAVAKKSAKYGYISKDGKWVVKPQFNELWPIMNGFGCGRIGDEWLLLNAKGETIFKFTRPKIWHNDYHIALNGGLPLVETPEGNGIMNDKGDWVVPPIYNGRVYMADGGWAIKDKSFKWHIFDRNGREILPEIQFEYVYDYNDGIAVVRLEDNPDVITYIRKDGVIIKSDTGVIYPFKNGVGLVSNKENKGLIDTCGNWIARFNPSLGFLYELENGFAAYFKSGKVGYLSDKGEIITEPLYDAPYYDFEFNHAIVRQGNKTGIIDSKGDLVVEMSHSKKVIISESIFAVSESANEWTFYSFIGTEKLFQKEMSSCWALSDGLIIFSREIE